MVMEQQTVVVARSRVDQHDSEVPEDFRAALRYLQSSRFLRTSRYQAQQWKAERRGADPALLEFERLFVSRCRELDIPVYAATVFVSEAVQNRLFVTGKSDQKAGESPHNEGLAVEILHSQYGRDLPARAWQLLGHIGEEIARRSGIPVEWAGLDQPWLWKLSEPTPVPAPGEQFVDGRRVPAEFLLDRELTLDEKRRYSEWVYSIRS